MWALVKPFLFLLPAETAHEWSMKVFSTLDRLPFVRRSLFRLTNIDDRRLQTDICGIRFRNPVGLAAGFDKNARWFGPLSALGFGSIEIGSLTGQGQPGNPKPRLFRLPSDRALINRMGFNNQGAEIAARNLGKSNVAAFRKTTVLGINLGKTKVVPNEQANQDYASSFRLLYPFADYFVLNVSSPNTPGLRELQEREPLISLLHTVDRLNTELAAASQESRRPVFLKIAPDLTDEQLQQIAEIAAQPFVDGLIATNTTIARPGLKTSIQQITKFGMGGLSGQPLYSRSLEVVRFLYRATGGKKPIIGVGGISNSAQAWEMITAGASLLQIYTGLIYGGPFTVSKINRGLVQQLARHGFDSISQAVGSAHND